MYSNSRWLASTRNIWNSSYNLPIFCSYDMPKLYIIAGCNGAGKTTASYTVLPEMLVAKSSSMQTRLQRGYHRSIPKGVAIEEAGRLMLQRMDDLLSEGADFAFETTLATRSYVKFIERAHAKGYFVTLLYFWPPTPEQAYRTRW